MFHKLGKRKVDKRIILETISISHYVEKVFKKFSTFDSYLVEGPLGDGLHEHPVRGGGKLWDSRDHGTGTFCAPAEGEQYFRLFQSNISDSASRLDDNQLCRYSSLLVWLPCWWVLNKVTLIISKKCVHI